MALLCIINGSLSDSTMSTRGGLIVCPDFSFSKNQDNIIIISVTSVGSSDLPQGGGERARRSSDSVSWAKIKPTRQNLDHHAMAG